MTPVEQPGSDGAADPDLLHDFIDFYKTTVHRTFGTAYRAAGRDTHVAHDATQEAYAVMPKLWLDNRCVPLEEEHDWGCHETGYAKVLNTMTVLPVVRDLLDRQPLRRRAVGVLYFLEEFNYPEIAETLGMSCSTARTHVQRLREALQPLINRITLDHRGGERP